MDVIVTQQEELGKKIIQLYSNCKKDSQSRKTQQYVEQKIETLEELWEAVRENDHELNKFNEPNHSYFTKKYVLQIKEKYDACKKYLENIRDELQKTPQLLLLKKQSLKCEELDRTIDQINQDLNEPKSIIRYELQQKKLVKQWEAIQELHEEIIIHEESFTNAYFKNDKFHEYQTKYEDTLEKLSRKTAEAQSLSQQQLPQTQPNWPAARHLTSPQITIPTFHGGYENWASFHDVFLRVVHDNIHYSKAEKIQLLKTHVRGEAARLIQHLTTTENNYETAWDLLQNRYENKRLLASKLIDKLLDLPDFSNGNIEKLKLLHDVTRECTRGLENIGVSTQSWGPIIVRIISRKWDPETNKMYEQTITEPHKIQDYKQFMEFLERRFQSLEATSPNRTANRNSSASCQYCRKEHALYQCQTFRKLSVEEKNRFVQRSNLCSNCLCHEKHTRCHSSSTCNICRKHHHTILHNENFQRNFSNSANNTSRRTDQRSSNQTENHQTRNNFRRNDQRQNTSNYHIKDKEENVLLATALVEVATDSTTQYLRVLIDQGSQSAFITEDAAQRLNLPRQKIRAEISGIGDGSPQVCYSAVDIRIKPRFPSDFSLEVKMLVLPKLTQSTPRHQLEVNSSHPNEILADPTYMKPGPIDAIVGAREYTHLILNGIRKTDEGLLKQNTELGWMVSGGVSSNHLPLQVTSMISRHEEDSQLTKFWELEELPETNKYISADDEICEKIYDETTYRDEEGRFIVRIPFKPSCTESLGQSKPRAAARLKSLENRFLREPNLKEQYEAFMDEYLRLGHMRKVSPQNLHEGRYYIPHQAVVKMDRTTTKLRVVFDASSKSTSNVSLNDLMLTGPRLQQNLAEILLRWRQHKVVFTADIEKMYRQIKIHEEDQPYQRIIWRSDSEHRMIEYELTTVTYGTASAPYLAIKTLQTLAKVEETNYPIASKITLRDFYVDDVLSGANDLESAIEIQRQLINMMKSAGFNLRKWTSNNTALLQALPESQREQTVQELSEDGIQKSLGVFWSPYDDNFMFRVTLSSDNVITKRQILSEISKIFDPLGWLSPIVIKSKVLIQDLWLHRLGWDEKIEGELAERWLTFKNNIHKVEDIKIPRWMQFNQENKIQLHGFCDASEKAYGAVVYSRTITTEGEIAVTLLWAKSKVAPVKLRTTLPRLELCAAHLLAKMINQTISTLEIQNIETFLWSDSMITLGWIKGQPNRWKTFVANRVSDINRYLDSCNWNHVKTSENPADVISRGCNPEKLAEDHLWWSGPAWLHSHRPLPVTKEIPATDQEAKKTMKCFHAKVQITENIIERFSDLTRMIRTLSYCRRVIYKSNKPILSIDETRMTFQQIIKVVQNCEFSSEILSLTTKKNVDKSSKIYNLNPFIDGEQILRVGGRLQNSELPYNQKHPIILPSQNHLSKLIIMDGHHKTLHGGNQATLAYLRRKYWIINGKRTVRSILSKCITCIRYKAKTSEQQMGQLPSTRVTPSPPFINSGVDYAGPIKIRATKGRGHKSYKGYISVFVCLSTKAIHLEAVSDMTTDSFLAAFRRFTARRGHCENIYSDNGTNFVGAAHYFEEEVLKLTQQQSFLQTMVNLGTNWHFIPPAAPHFGGLWEAGVKSMKHHLKRVIGETTLTYEELTTLLHQIEASLNSRPLWPLSEEVDDYFVLTPGHFLIGREILSPLDPIANNINSSLAEKWRLIQKMKKDFWKVWSTEYLGRLQQRYKWQDRKTNLKKGTMVLIKENTINPSRWPLARVTDVHPGEDGIVRVVTLRKADRGTLKRPIHTLIPLPIEEIEDTPTNPTQVTANIAITSSTHYNRRIQENEHTIEKSKAKSHLRIIPLLLLCFSLMFLPQCQSSYDIKYPKGGFIVEHFGTAQINRGTFRMEVNYNKTKIKEDIQNVTYVVTNFEKLCNKARKISEETHCEILDHHLKEQQQHIGWIFKTLHEIQSRQKRGLLGKFLTSVFGVNDEVYEDINNINRNQEMLIKASNHQTKFMISALSTFNATEERINNQLHRFEVRLNQGLDAIQSMNKWFSSVDTNSLNIHVLSTYQIATNYIAEISTYYENIINIQFTRGTIYDIISPTYLHTLIADINKKLPSNLEAVSTPVMEMSLSQNNSHFQIFGYFPIIDISQFDVIKATPIPVRITNNSYWTLAITNDYIAIDYNSQLYFQVQKEEFERCLKLNLHLVICSPDVIRNIDNDGNCIIDEIYHKPEAKKCKTFRSTVEATIWKQMASPNTWLFITNGSANIAVVCGGVREDVAINATGILSMTPDCIIKTKQLTLTAKRVEHSSMASYSKAVALEKHEEPTFIQHSLFKSASESVIGHSDSLNSLMTEEKSIQTELQNHIWQKVQHHTTIVGVTTAMVTIMVVLVIWVGIKFIRHRRKGTLTTKPEEFELQSLKSTG